MKQIKYIVNYRNKTKQKKKTLMATNAWQKENKRKLHSLEKQYKYIDKYIF